MAGMKPETVISGLLAKRADLFNEAERIRDRLAEIRNDIGAVDRVLGTLGYIGKMDAEMPRQKRNVLFGPGEANPRHLGRTADHHGAAGQPRHCAVHSRSE